MIRRHRTLLRWLLAVGDAVAAGMLIVAVSKMRFATESGSIWSGVFTAPWVPAVIFIVGWIATLWALGLYRHNLRRTLAAQALEMAKAFLLFTVITFALLYALKLPEVSRAYLLALLPSMAIASLVLRAFIHICLLWLQLTGKNVRNVVVVGSGTSAVRFTREVDMNSSVGIRVIGYLDTNGNHEASVGVPYLGPVESLFGVLHHYVVDEVALCIDLAEWRVVESVIAV